MEHAIYNIYWPEPIDEIANIPQIVRLNRNFVPPDFTVGDIVKLDTFSVKLLHPPVDDLGLLWIVLIVKSGDFPLIFGGALKSPLDIPLST